MSDPLISVVIPVYNAERYLHASIESVIKQSYSNFELIIVDDFSDDNSWNIINSFIDNRIKKIRRNQNSGSAYLPREQGVANSKGEWIVNLDADDYLGEDYLLELLQKAQSNNADICCSRMVIYNGIEKNEIRTIPDESFNYDQRYRKNDAFNLTLPDWKISMNGAMIKKTIWLDSIEQNKIDTERNIHDDENLSRIMLYNADCFVVAKTDYFYNLNTDSITRKFSLKQLNWRFSNKQLIEYIKKQTGEFSSEHIKGLIYDYYSYKYVLNLFCKSPINEKELEYCIKLLEKWHKTISWDIVRKEEKNIKSFIFRDFPMSLFMCVTLHFREWRKFVMLFKVLLHKAHNKLMTLDFFAWHYVRKKREEKSKKLLSIYYNNNEDIEYDNFVINIYSGIIQSGGLADRLKGILSTYYVAKSKNIPYKIFFIEPFPLNDFLCPNLYDWRIEDTGICRNKKKVNVIILDNVKDSNYQYIRQKKYLEKKVENGKQTHVYTNASFSYGLNYSEMFNELFKPSDRLQKSIDRELRAIGKEYISISCRFMDLLGDFNETHGYGFELPLVEKEELINKIKNTIEDIHKNNNEYMILLNSDSKSFLKKYKNIDYIYVVEGNITHIDHLDSSYSFEKYEKTFLDFMLISQAKKIYLIKSDLMFNSGFPYAASKVGNCEYEVIEI